MIIGLKFFSYKIISFLQVLFFQFMISATLCFFYFPDKEMTITTRIYIQIPMQGFWENISLAFKHFPVLC